VKKWREDGGRKRWKAREENRREAVENRREAGRSGKRGKKIGGRREAVESAGRWRQEVMESCRRDKDAWVDALLGAVESCRQDKDAWVDALLEAVESCRQDKDAWVDALFNEIKHVVHDALSEEQDKVEAALCL
jgi:N-formylglutamate amidohydrolase